MKDFKLVITALALIATFGLKANAAGVGFINYQKIQENYSFAIQAVKEVDAKGLELQQYMIDKEKQYKTLDTPLKKKNFEDAMVIANKKHDVVAIQVYDKRVEELPNIGLIKIKDAETGHEQWIDTSSRAVRKAHHNWWMEKQTTLHEMFLKSNIDNICIRTDQDYVKALLSLFAKRN